MRTQRAVLVCIVVGVLVLSSIVGIWKYGDLAAVWWRAGRTQGRAADEPIGNAVAPDLLGVRGLSPAPLPFKAEEFEGVVEAYVSEDLGDDEARIQLPPDRSTLTRGGYVYVTKDYSREDIFLFVTWQGKGSNLRGYVYCPGRKDFSSLLTNAGYLMINCPRPGDPSGYAKVEVQVLKHMTRDGWCYVSRTLD